MRARPGNRPLPASSPQPARVLDSSVPRIGATGLKPRERSMHVRVWLIVPVLVAAGAVVAIQRSPAALAAAPQVESSGSSTLDDQTELALTVYNSDLALVRDVRAIQLPRGGFDL